MILKSLAYVAARLREPSSMAALGTIAVALGASPAVVGDLSGVINTVGLLVLGAAALIPDGK